MQSIDNLITLEAFRKFVESKPPEEQYCYSLSGNCAFCQFLQHLGFKDAIVGPYGYYLNLPFQAGKIPFPDPRIEFALVHGKHTFGALAERLP